MIKDQAIRDRVLDLNASFLVQAPAGSGKTSILVQRFLLALAHAKAEPEEIVAITFTRKAAAQMRARILDALLLAAKAAPTDPYELTVWQLARQVLQKDQQHGWHLQDNPSRLKIQTIDSLCSSIVQQMPILTRFGAQPQIEPMPGILYNRAIDQLFANLEHAEIWQAPFFTLLAHLDNDRLRAKKLLLSMLQIREHWLLALGSRNKQIDLKQQLEAGLSWVLQETLEDLLASIPPALNFALLGVEEPTSVADWLIIANLLLTAEGEWRKKFNKNQGFPPASSGRNVAEKQLYKERNQAGLQLLEYLNGAEDFRMRLLNVRELPPATYNPQQWQILEALTKILPLLAAQLLVVFRDSGMVDFTEVALAAITALADQDAPTDLALSLDCKIQHILVDEFQDTSHLQFRLLEQLTVNWEPYDGRSLFLVGDPMQSIYRFRQAEVSLFLKAKEQGINKIPLEFVQLQVNFRAQAGLLDKINHIFAHSFPKIDNMTLGAISYMPAQAAIAAIDGAPIEFLAVESKVEYAQIVAIIQQVQATNPQHSIAVLVQAKAHLLQLLPALRQAQIAYQGLEIEKLAARPLIQDLCALTNSMLHLDDRIAWLAILRAPWCGLALVDLAMIAKNDSTIWAAIQIENISNSLSTDAQVRLNRFVTVMQQALQQLDRINLDLLVKNTWLALGGYQCLGVATEQYQEAEAFFALLARLNFNRELLTPNFLLEQIEQLFLSQTTAHINPVQIMTMHKAKGLEFDVVILPALDKNTRGNEHRLLLLEQRSYQHEYLLVAPIKATSEEKDAIYDYLAWCEKQRQKYEQLRLLYVAMTRAKQKIYCLADIKDEALTAGGMLAAIWPLIKTAFVNVNTENIVVPVEKNFLARLPLSWYQANPYLLPASITINHKFADLPQDWLRLTGIAMHRVLWHVAMHGVENLFANQQQILAIFLPKYLRQLGLVPTQINVSSDIIRQALANMLADPLGAKILSAQYSEAYAEWRLTYTVGKELAQVVLDRAFLTPENVWWLVDYKLVQDVADINVAVHMYKTQIQRYVRVLMALKPGAQIIAGLYFPLQAQWRELEQL